VIDLHCHILPSADDGPSTFAESLEMCRLAARDGIRAIVATPHTLNDVHTNEGEWILREIGRLEAEMGAHGVKMRILAGSEVHVDPATPALIKAGRVMTLNNNQRTVLLEFPDFFIPEAMIGFLRTLREAELIPVIGHPERQDQFADDGLIEELVDSGGFIQVTAMSLTGDFGSEVQSRTFNWLEKGLVHVIASDAHSPDHRPPILSRAVAQAARILGKDRARRLVVDNPLALLNGTQPSGSH